MTIVVHSQVATVTMAASQPRTLSFLQKVKCSLLKMCLFFSPEVTALEVATSVDEGDEGSVELLAESGNSIEVYPHHRFLCIKYPFSTDPKIHCVNCFCVVCEERASDCNNWNAHCSISKGEYEEMLHW
jgi:hypothetical protein